MSSPITFSGANGIDFNVILNALMQQEQAPLTTLQTQQQNLQAKSSAYATLATKLNALATASDDLRSASLFNGRAIHLRARNRTHRRILDCLNTRRINASGTSSSAVAFELSYNRNLWTQTRMGLQIRTSNPTIMPIIASIPRTMAVTSPCSWAVAM